jgi:hypothetical protein
MVALEALEPNMIVERQPILDEWNNTRSQYKNDVLCFAAISRNQKVPTDLVVATILEMHEEEAKEAA